MKRFWNPLPVLRSNKPITSCFSPLFLSGLISFFLISCASISGAPVDPIVGRWDGVGYESTFHASFDKNHTFRLSDSWADKENDATTGTWTLRDGKYILPSGEDHRTGTIDAQGQLIISAEGIPIKLYFQRHGAKAPAPAAAGKPPVGEWRFAYTSKSSIPANSPPPFDVMSFLEQGKVRLKSSAATKEFNLNYQLAGNVISIVTGEAALPKLDFSYRWEDGGKTLLLSVPQAQHGPFEIEWAFMKPDQFLPNDIKGIWVGDMRTPDMNEEIEMGLDGRWSRTVTAKDGKAIHKNNARVSDYYRLWKAPFGNALTVVTFNAEMGAQLTQIFKLEKKPNEITVTPVELTEDGKLKPHQEARFTWKLKNIPQAK